MVFVSNSFVFFFLPIFLVVYWITPRAQRNLCILLFSWIFYAWWRVDFLLLLIGIAAWSWSTGLWISTSSGSAKSSALFAAIMGPLAALAWFKYANLAVDTLRSFGMPLSYWQNVTLPIGLSFFVFGAISYSVDVYRRTVAAERSFIDYATYQSMFGHLIAGPIVRYQWISERLKSRVFDRAEFATGIERFMIGFAQKVLLADTLAPMVDAGFALGEPTTIDAIIATCAYTLQLYFDFAGYSHMAIGLGLMVGLRFPENFRHPYLSVSLPEFWRRWHISLSSWLRDYLYFPLGGSRGNLLRTCGNLLVTMGLGGLWHGASWTFLVWGLWHGAGLVFVRIWQSLALPKIPVWFSYITTLIFVMLGWSLFRAQTWQEAYLFESGLMGMNGFRLSNAYAVAIRPIEVVTLLLAGGVIYAPLLYPLLQRFCPKLFRNFKLLVFPIWLFSLWVLQGRTVVPFLYFQF